MYDARVVANEVLTIGWKRGYQFSQLDIQKICYFLNGHHLLDHGVPLIKTDFEAWRHGPVQPLLYESFKRWGDSPISELATAFDPIRRQHKALPAITNNSARDTIEKYLDRYAVIPAHELVGITHRAGTPWQITRKIAESASNIGMIIDRNIIVQHFEGLNA